MAVLSKEYSFKSSNGVNTIFGLAYIPKDGEFKGYLQILHDIHEHINRYRDVMQFFASHGYLCFGHDHMGHGKSVESMDRLGYFDGNDCDIRLIDDANLMYEKIREDYPILNTTPGLLEEEKQIQENEANQLFLHGMIGVGFGATIAKLYVIKYPDINALVLCGDKGPNIFAFFELAYCKNRIKKLGRDNHSQNLDTWMEGRYTKFVVNPQNGYEWHSRDSFIVNQLVQDKLCTFRYSLGAYQALFSLDNKWNNRHWYKVFPHFLATYVIAGTYDPVSNYTRNLTPMISRLSQNGAKNVFHRFYEDARHDLFFETNRRQVYDDVLNFIKIVERQQLKKQKSA